MAALNKKKNNDGSYRYSIQFYLGGIRKTIGIGSKYTQSEMGRMVSIIERLAGYRDTDTVPDPRILQQAESLPNEIKTALAKIKLICHTGQIKVGELWERYIDSSCDKKECTLISIKQVARNFLEYFESDVSIDTISEADADSWKRHLKQKFAPATIAGFIAQTKSAFTFAVRNKWISDSPFRWIKKGSYRNPVRQFFVPPEWVPSILDACSCSEWRVLFALARFGGLRIPSESSELRWSDILWDKNRFYIRSRKTEAHEGHEGRMSPLWPELKTELETLWDMVEEGGSEFVLGSVRNTSNPATTFKKIIVRAGYAPWPKPFQNCRATRDTELKLMGFTDDQRSAWLGHTEAISETYYQIKSRLVTDSDFDSASARRTLPATDSEQQTSAKTSATTGYFEQQIATSNF